MNEPDELLCQILLWDLVFDSLNKVILVGVPLASLVELGVDNLFDPSSILIEDLVHVAHGQHLIGLILLEKEESHA
jgi:hypothetical protein